MGELLAQRTPSLTNVGCGSDPINAGADSCAFPFNENLPPVPPSCLQPRVNCVPGAIAIQNELDRVDWAQQFGNPIAYAPHLRKQPLDGVPTRPVLFTFAKGDPVVANTTMGNLLRAGDLADRTIYFRALDAYPGTKPLVGQNPALLHEWLVQINGTGAPFALAGQESVDTFLASDGQVTVNPNVPPGPTGPLFETPIASSLP